MSTLCMALKSDNVIHLVSDRMITDTELNYRFITTTPKIIPIGTHNHQDVIAMPAGPIVLNTLLRARPYFEDAEELDVDLFETHILAKLLPELMQTQRDFGYSASTDGADDGDLLGSMLVIYDNTIYAICEHRSILDVGLCGVVGSSSHVVYPAVSASRHFTDDPRLMLRATIQACLDLDPYISAPFDYATYTAGQLSEIRTLNGPSEL